MAHSYYSHNSRYCISVAIDRLAVYNGIGISALAYNQNTIGKYSVLYTPNSLDAHKVSSVVCQNVGYVLLNSSI